MAAIVTGTGLGLERSSGWVLGSRGELGDSSFGRYGENVTVNAANGNLIINRTDEILIGLGRSDTLSRSYNSLGTGTDDNGDNWRLNAQRQVTGLTGTVNTAGSTITRIDWDGSAELYSYDSSAGCYVCKDGAGAYDTLSLTSNVWTWTDGNSRNTETYDDLNGGRITAASDADGNQLTYSYTGSLLTRVTTASGETTDLTWSGNNLTQIVTTKFGGATLSRVRYAYDASNRLSTVTTDLSPDDHSISDGATVVTTYTYDGTSDRVASITQTGGAELDIAYTLVGSDYRVASLTQTVATGVTRVTSFSYDTVNNVTTVTDANGQVTSLAYDANGQLTQVSLPPAQSEASSQVISYTYNANGDVLTATDPLGNITTYTYDANGNQLTATDPLGNAIVRTYSATNALLTETRNPAGTTTRFAYDTEGHLRFAVSALGEVTEYDYNTAGQRVSSIAYRDNTYSLTGLASSDPISESALSAWAAGLTDKSTVMRTDTTYDFRGNVATVTSYSAAATDGTGLTSQTYTVISYTYDQFGNLLSRQTSGIGNSEVFTYDGLGRTITSVDLNGGATSVAFTDSANQAVVTLANGLVKTSTYDKAGELVSYAESGTGIATATTTYKYDSLGQLRMVTDATGLTHYNLYDNVGRKVADIAADGAIIEYGYDADNRLVQTIVYATKLTTAQLNSLVDGSDNPANVTLASVRPSSNAGDRWEWRIYDAGSRLIEVIGGDGSASVFAYDGSSNLLSTTSYANLIASGTISGFKTATPTTLQLPTANAAADNVARNFYDADGRLIGVLDGAGYLSEILYNGAGQKTETIGFAGQTNSALRAAGTFAQLLSDVGTDSGDIHERLFYDDRGLLRYKLDANLRPCEYVYDAAGNLINTIEYGASITSTSAYTFSYVQNQTAALSGNADNRLSWAVYDAAGRVAYAIDAMGDVTAYTYNNLGLAVKLVRYATQRATTSSPSLATMDSWAAGQASNTSNRVSRMVYDLQGRLVYGVDPEGYVTEHRFDLAGRSTLDIRYADVYTVTDSVTQASLAALIGGTFPSTAVQTSASYDPAGRLADTYDGEGVRTHFDYDALGRVTDRTVAYGTGDAATTHFTYDAAGHVASQTSAYGASEASTTSFTYDGMGHVLTRTDGRGNTTTYTYDALGHVLTATVPIDASNNAVTTNTYDAFGNLSTTTDPLGNISYFFYDTLNRLTLQVDGENYATATAYTIGDEVASVTRYATRVSGTITPGTAPAVTTNAADATTGFTRDKLGQVTQTTDAEGNYEQYTLDAFGNRLTVRNKLGGVTTNVFDRRGLLTSQTIPMTSIWADGTTEATSVTNTFQYDARGNRTRMVEASGLTEQRTTTYAYDKLDRLVQTTHDSVQVVATDLATVSNITPTETLVYDKRGNVIQTTDAAGARTLFYYDELNRKVASVNALGTLSAWTYDANGNATSVRVYGDAVTLPGSPGGTAPNPVNPSNYRETLYTYDRANELLTTTVANLRTGQYTTAYATSTGNVVITNTYDKDGHVVRQDDGRGNSVWFYYDKLDRKIAQVDQENYLTCYTRDQNGNVVTEERFATKLSSTPTTASDPATLRSSVAGNANDRITNFTYDRNGRRLTEARTGVTAWTINTSTGALAAASTTATVTYTYNALGEVTRKTEATGDYTDYAYDGFGRQTSTTSSSFTDYNGLSVQDTTSEYYDGLNNLVRTVRDSSRVTTYTYGAGGRLSSMTDAAGFVHNYAYDVLGHTLKESYSRTKSDGSSVTEANASRYDALGRTIFQSVASLSGSTWSFGDQSQVQYNTYGEVTAKGLNGLWQETFSYDSGGRVWKSTADDGTVKLYVYDGNGKQTLLITSNGAALPSGYSWSTITIDQAVNLLTNNGASAIGTVSVAGMVVTMTVYDKRGQNIQTREPLRQLDGTTTATITHGHSYNAFGEVSQEIDARGNVTDYGYNTVGKLIQRQSPSVSWTAENGAMSSARPTENYYYDLSGRLVGVADANGNLNTRSLLSGSGYGGDDASVLKEFHADTGIFERKYDVFGDLRTTINEVGKTETYNYDAMDRLTSQVHQSRPANSPGNPTGSAVQLTDNYTYDGLGHRLTHWNSQLGSSVKETTDYDSQGRVTSMVDMGGNTTTYGYAWSSTIATTGLGTFGGWTKTTVNSASRTATEKDDYFGRTVDKVDYGSHDYNYTFDLAGRLVGRTNSAGENVAYAYYNTGLLSSETNSYTSTYTGDTVTGTYKYDAEGNRTYESYTENGFYTARNSNLALITKTYSGSYHSATVTWDALNRMTSFSDTGVGGTDPATIAWEYDLNSNIRHMYATLRYLDDYGNVATTDTIQDYWYKYDAMNRFVVTKGAFSGTRGSGTIGGTSISYNLDGTRATALAKTYVDTFTDPETGHVWTSTVYETEKYTYTADGFLAQVDLNRTQQGINPNVDTGTFLEAAYTRDAMGRVTDYREYDSTGTSVVYERTAAYNAKSQVTSDQVTSVRSDGTWVSSTNYDYNLETSPGNGVWTGAYQGGVVTHQRTTTTKNGTAQPTSDTINTFVWWDQALQSTIAYKPNINNSTTYNSTYYYGDSGQLAAVYILDGTGRTISFGNDVDGLIITRDVLANGGPTVAAPHERHYWYNGIQVGDVSNNGTSDIDYAASITEHTKVPGTGRFRDGATTGTKYADFDQSYDPINGLNFENTSSHYTVQDGDTLQGIAYNLWGDSSLWYLIADANGLSGDETLVAGQDLTIPNKVHNVHNSSDTYRVYDPNEAIGDTSPTHRKPPKHGGNCGVVGQILLTIVAVVVAYYVFPLALTAIGPAGVTASTAEAGDLIAAGAISGAASSAASQGIGVATGIQSKFDWAAVGMAAISGAVSAGIGPGGVFGEGGAFSGIESPFLQGALRGALGSALTQGIGVATGLQRKFDWAGVAAAGIEAGVSAQLGNWIGYDAKLPTSNLHNDLLGGVSGMAGVVANAATRSLISGGDFGDNLMAALPDAIGQTIGNLIVGSVARNEQFTPTATVQRLLSSVVFDRDITDGDLAAAEDLIASLDERSARVDDAINTFFKAVATTDAEKGAISDFRNLVWPSRGSSEICGPNTVVATADPNSLNYFVSRTVDDAGVWAGSVRDTIGESIDSFLNSHPGAAIALNVASVGLTIGGGLERAVAGLAWNWADNRINGLLTRGYEDAGWDTSNARLGGAGMTWAGSLILGAASIAGGGMLGGLRTGESEVRGGVYVLRDKFDNIVRTGRTNNLVRREREHDRSLVLGRFNFETVHKTDDYYTQRGLEQMLHDQYNPRLNFLNPISPLNPMKPTYMKAAEKFLSGE